MNTPDLPILDALAWLIDTPSVGGVVVFVVATTMVSIATSILRWIFLGSKADETDVYTYPTPTLLGHTDSE